MEDRTEDLPIVRVTKGSREMKEDVVVREIPLTIFLNSQELVTLSLFNGIMVAGEI